MSGLKRDQPTQRIETLQRDHTSKTDERDSAIRRAHKAKRSRTPRATYCRYSNRGQEINKKIDAINEAMWAAVQEGTVAVHCLAGIHRAACIMACHFLYRYYILGQKHIPHNTTDIYKKMISVRPHVSPAYEDILRGYEAYLKTKVSGR